MTQITNELLRPDIIEDKEQAPTIGSLPLIQYVNFVKVCKDNLQTLKDYKNSWLITDVIESSSLRVITKDWLVARDNDYIVVANNKVQIYKEEEFKELLKTSKELEKSFKS